MRLGRAGLKAWLICCLPAGCVMAGCLMAGCLLAGCQSFDRSANLWLFNRTDHPVYYWITCDSSFRDMEMKREYRIKAHDSVKPYLLYGPEGEGPNKSSWVNAINRADGKALHVFYYYIDFDGDADLGDSLYHLIIRRGDYRVDSLVNWGWRVEYTEGRK
jgi:hypothetical protein